MILLAEHCMISFEGIVPIETHLIVLKYVNKLWL